jgi:hypothetical protein
MSQEVKDAVFGNVGSMIAFRMGADDARSMQRYFEPKFEEYDLVHMHNRHIVINMTIAGEKTPAFSAVTLDLPPGQEDHSAEIIQNSRAEFALHRPEVEAYIGERYGLTAKAVAAKPQAAPSKPTPQPAVESVARPETQAAKPEARPVTKRPAEPKAGVGRTAIVASEVAVKLKRKRRRRNKKPVDSLAPGTEKEIFLNRK